MCKTDPGGTRLLSTDVYRITQATAPCGGTNFSRFCSSVSDVNRTIRKSPVVSEWLRNTNSGPSMPTREAF